MRLLLARKMALERIVWNQRIRAYETADKRKVNPTIFGSPIILAYDDSWWDYAEEDARKKQIEKDICAEIMEQGLSEEVNSYLLSEEFRVCSVCTSTAYAAGLFKII